MIGIVHSKIDFNNTFKIAFLCEQKKDKTPSKVLKHTHTHIYIYLLKYNFLYPLQGARISLNQQLLNHEIIVGRIVQILGNKELATQHLSKCIYLIGIGSNDYVNNYFLPQFYPTSRLFTPDQYSIVLIQQLRLQLQVFLLNLSKLYLIFS